MICSFLKGKHKKNLKNKDIKILLDSLKKLHKIEINKKKFNLKKELKKYKEELNKPKVNKLIKDSLSLLKKLKKYKYDPVLCHHDLNPQNILFHKNKAKFIDWEFSCINDRFFDLATICVEFNFSKKQEKYLLKTYFKNIKKNHLRKLNIYKQLAINLWKLWFKSLEKR